MTTINIRNSELKYNAKTKTFAISGKAVKFDTTYRIFNTETLNEQVFEFKQSTGSEWDPNTIWIYESVNKEYILAVGNGDVTEAHRHAYAVAKGYENETEEERAIDPRQLGADGIAMTYGLES